MNATTREAALFVTGFVGKGTHLLPRSARPLLSSSSVWRRPLASSRSCPRVLYPVCSAAPNDDVSPEVITSAETMSSSGAESSSTKSSLDAMSSSSTATRASSSAGAGPSWKVPPPQPPVPGSLSALTFSDSFVQKLPRDLHPGRNSRQVRDAAYSLVDPTPPSETDNLPIWLRGMAEGSVATPPPQLQRALAGWSPSAAALIGIHKFSNKDPDFEIDVLGGFGTLCPGMRPYAANYGGHQFGNWAGQLGDGRAITLGEVAGWELQIKGAGRTPYSRTADGRAVLRSSVREFLCSESVHFLGVPTTRALSLVTTGAGVIRDMFYSGSPQLEPGAVVCRMAPSFLRLGSFQLPASRGEFELLGLIADYAIENHFPDLDVPADGNKYAEFVREVSRLNAIMVARWMAIGFVHGVMNTDNFSILGLTIDYGPYGFMDAYDPDYTPNTTDLQGRRYKYSTQPDVARWNILQFVQAMVPLTSVAEMQKVVDEFPVIYEEEYNRLFAAKLGLGKLCEAGDKELLADFLDLLEAGNLDFTNSWRTLSNVSRDMKVEDAMTELEILFEGRQVNKLQWDSWLERYLARLVLDEEKEVMDKRKRKQVMDAANPVYILRNYMAQTAIEKASEGDYSEIERLYRLLTKPYEQQKGMEKYTHEPPDWAQRRGVKMNSCSS